jgi:cytochrome c peroxidase
LYLRLREETFLMKRIVHVFTIELTQGDGMKQLYKKAMQKAKSQRRRTLVAAILGAVFITTLVSADSHLNNLRPFDDLTGRVRTVSTSGEAQVNNAFFQSLGTNGRSCATCHQASDAWTVTPEHIRARFDASNGLDPIFRTNDGANCPSADVTTLSARRKSYSMLLNKGLIRVSIGVPANAEFAVTGIDDPHSCAETTPAGLALFRRPLPSTNLPFLTTVMWDGRESFKGQTLNFNLSDQAVGATLGHAQASHAPTSQQVAEIVSFELSNFTAQIDDDRVGNLNADGAQGGPKALTVQPFSVGINDPLGGTPPGVDFNPVAMTLFSKWASLKGEDSDEGRNAARAAVARGEALFNTFPIPISGVSGLNDLPGVPASFVGSCTTCHNTPNVGNHSVPLAINIGVTEYPPVPALDISGLPVYTIHCAAGAQTPINHDSTIQTTDPVRALVTGKCADIGKTKGPILRGLAARAPYFHNGSAATLRDVINFYEQRFQLSFTEEQKTDLEAFLRSL